MALVANAKFKGRTFFRIAILIPGAIPTVVSSQIWKWMFNDVYGVVNLLLTNFHIIPEKIAWLAVPETAIPVIIAVDVWKTVPFMALLILAGLQTIPGDMVRGGCYRWSHRNQDILLSDASVHNADAACGTYLSDPRCPASVRYLLHHGLGRQVDMATMATYNRLQLIDFLDAGVGSATSVIILIFIMVFVVLYTTTMSKTSFQ